MELKHLIQRFAYKIEPKPEGGFIARSTDPTVPALEAPTREELQQKIQANIVAALGEAFPRLKPPIHNMERRFEVHIERKPGGGFTVHSDEPGAQASERPSHEQIDHFAEELLGFVDKNFPQLSQAIAARAGSGDIKVSANETIGVSLNTSSEVSGAESLLPTQPIRSSSVGMNGTQVGDATTANATLNDAVITNTPITPQASSTGTVFRFLLALLVIAALMFFFLHRR